MNDRVKVLKTDRPTATVRLINDRKPAPVRRASNPLASLMESCRQVELAAARAQAAVAPLGKPVQPAQKKPTVSELAAGILANKKRRTSGGINRFERHRGGASIVAQREVVTKAPAPQPKPYEPDEAAVTALRAAFGLGTRRDQVEGTRKQLIQDTRTAEKIAKARAAARKEVIEHPVATGSVGNPAEQPKHWGLVYAAIHRRWVANKRVPVSISAAEIARETALTVADVNAAIDALWSTGQIQRYGRAGGPTRWAPAA